MDSPSSSSALILLHSPSPSSPPSSPPPSPPSSLLSSSSSSALVPLPTLQLLPSIPQQHSAILFCPLASLTGCQAQFVCSSTEANLQKNINNHLEFGVCWPKHKNSNKEQEHTAKMCCLCGVVLLKREDCKTHSKLHPHDLIPKCVDLLLSKRSNSNDPANTYLRPEDIAGLGKSTVRTRSSKRKTQEEVEKANDRGELIHCPFEPCKFTCWSSQAYNLNQHLRDAITKDEVNFILQDITPVHPKKAVDDYLLQNVDTRRISNKAKENANKLKTLSAVWPMVYAQTLRERPEIIEDLVRSNYLTTAIPNSVPSVVIDEGEHEEIDLATADANGKKDLDEYYAGRGNNLLQLLERQQEERKDEVDPKTLKHWVDKGGEIKQPNLHNFLSVCDARGYEVKIGKDMWESQWVDFGDEFDDNFVEDPAPLTGADFTLFQQSLNITFKSNPELLSGPIPEDEAYLLDDTSDDDSEEKVQQTTTNNQDSNTTHQPTKLNSDDVKEDQNNNAQPQQKRLKPNEL